MADHKRNEVIAPKDLSGTDIHPRIPFQPNKTRPWSSGNDTLGVFRLTPVNTPASVAAEAWRSGRPPSLCCSVETCGVMKFMRERRIRLPLGVLFGVFWFGVR